MAKKKLARESLETKLDEFLKHYTKDKLFCASYAWMTTVEDTCEHGEVGHEHLVWDQKLLVCKEKLSELVSHFSCITGCPEEGWVIDGSGNIIMVEWMVNQENYCATPHEIAQWENGTIRLWNARLYADILIVEQRTPSPKELAALTGMEII